MRGQPQLSVKWFEFYEHFNEGGIFREKCWRHPKLKIVASWKTKVISTLKGGKDLFRILHSIENYSYFWLRSSKSTKWYQIRTDQGFLAWFQVFQISWKNVEILRFFKMSVFAYLQKRLAKYRKSLKRKPYQATHHWKQEGLLRWLEKIWSL